MPTKKKQPTSATSQTTIVIIVIAILLCAVGAIVIGGGAIAFGGFSFWSSASNQSTVSHPLISSTTTTTPSTADSPWATVLPTELQPYVIDGQGVSISFENAPIQGSDQAPVTLIEFSDFECPFCKNYSSQTFPSLKTDYIDTGKVRSVFKNFTAVSTHNPASHNEAIAGFCANQQGKFLEYHDTVFAGTKGDGAGYLGKQGSLTSMQQLAGDLNLNMDQFNSCLTSSAANGQISADEMLIHKLAVSLSVDQFQLGTPSFWVCRTVDCSRGTLVEGAMPLGIFQTVLDHYLSQK